jgi:hypothetical protein
MDSWRWMRRQDTSLGPDMAACALLVELAMELLEELWEAKARARELMDWSARGSEALRWCFVLRPVSAFEPLLLRPVQAASPTGLIFDVSIGNFTWLWVQQMQAAGGGQSKPTMGSRGRHTGARATEEREEAAVSAQEAAFLLSTVR